MAQHSACRITGLFKKENVIWAQIILLNDGKEFSIEWSKIGKSEQREFKNFLQSMGISFESFRNLEINTDELFDLQRLQAMCPYVMQMNTNEIPGFPISDLEYAANVNYFKNANDNNNNNQPLASNCTTMNIGLMSKNSEDDQKKNDIEIVDRKPKRKKNNGDLMPYTLVIKSEQRPYYRFNEHWGNTNIGNPAKVNKVDMLKQITRMNIKDLYALKKAIELQIACREALQQLSNF